MQEFAGDTYNHAIAIFERSGANSSHFEKKNESCAMQLGDFVRYIKATEKKEETFSFEAYDTSKPSDDETIDRSDKKNYNIDLNNTKLYLLDFDIQKHLCTCHDDFVKKFKLGEILPGGQYCMMNAVTASVRPNMG